MQNPSSPPPLIAGLCLIHTIQNLPYGLAYTEIMVLLHLMLAHPKKISRDGLCAIIPRDHARISASLNLLKKFSLTVDTWNDKRKEWGLSEEGNALAVSIWNKYAVRYDAMKDILGVAEMQGDSTEE